MNDNNNNVSTDTSSTTTSTTDTITGKSIDWCKIFSKNNIKRIVQEDDNVGMITSESIDIITATVSIFLSQLLQDVIKERCCCSDESTLTEVTEQILQPTIAASITATNIELNTDYEVPVVDSVRPKKKKRKNVKNSVYNNITMIDITNDDIVNIVNKKEIFDFVRNPLQNIGVYLNATATKKSSCTKRRKRQEDNDGDTFQQQQQEEQQQNYAIPTSQQKSISRLLKKDDFENDYASKYEQIHNKYTNDILTTDTTIDNNVYMQQSTDFIIPDEEDYD